MTVRVPWHIEPGPDDEGYAKALGDSMAKSVRWLEESPGMFNSALGKAVMRVQARSSVDPVAGYLETWESVVCAMQVGSAMFAAASRTEGTVQCRIDYEVRTIPATGAQDYTDPGNWLTAFWFAIICRERARMTALCEIPLNLLWSSGGQYDEYIYHWVDALQTYWLKRPGLVDKLVAAIEGSYPQAATITPPDLLQNILYQPINLFHRFVRKDEAGFNQALVEALELHKQYWTADEERAGRIEGTIALGPLAIACLAYDGEIPIEVESEYLPKALLQRDWIGEYDT
ncbi:immunity 49 family protein [Streptomyces sp. NPDC058231]|uniref:immunity 49 family protein n=1 Tax=Streptomyces sp. NPDC058231 TaxID=3346392 RepID=UPI0036F0C11B